MRTFILLWLGQITSSVGSHMTYFALTLWVWQQTESATAVALILFFYQLPQIAIALVSGLLVDRVSRKILLILSDTGSACCTVSVGILAITQTLQVWHLYVIAAIIGCFGHIQTLTYTTIIPMLVPQEHHMRAAGMGAMAGYSTSIFAPALAGVLYPMIGLFGITVIDMGTFAIAALTLLFIAIPATRHTNDNTDKNNAPLWQTLTLGFRYIFKHPELRAMVTVLSCFAFLHQIGETIYQPMILARTGNDAQLLGTIVAAAGVGGLIGGSILTISGGFRNSRRGLLIGILSVGLGKLIFGFGQESVVWTGARLGASISEPIIFGTYTACWYAIVPAKLQGRAFAVDHLIGLLIGASASLIAGPLADYVFEPAAWLSMFGPIADTYPGFGMTVLYGLSAAGILMVGIVSRTQLPPLPSLRKGTEKRQIEENG
ncbi:MFS transporter [Leptothoe sp. LEGE 181152]|nr:MFS transporter [Leptothoe sp. LEGE 181152]